MKRRGMFLKGFIAAFIVVAVSITGVAQTTQPQAQSKDQPQIQPKDQPQAERQWKLYMESDTRKYYFDPASVQRLDKRVVRVWERITKANKEGAEVDKVESLMELDCGSSKYRILGSKDYDAVKPGEKPELRMENGPWTYFSLDTILGILYDNVCYTDPTGRPKIAPKARTQEKPKEEPKFGSKASQEKPKEPEEEPTFRK